MEKWTDKVFYHIYPLGMCGVPKQNDFCSPAGKGLFSLVKHIPRLLSLGINALYIGPLFESSSHGYDTVDYYHVERRLGNNNDLKELVRILHENDIAVILDAVFTAGFNQQVQHPRIWQKPQQESCNPNTSSVLN